jgi:hypothetical protein
MTGNTLFAEENALLTGNYSQSFGLGFECELIQRAAKAQIIKYLPKLTEELQNIWNHRDKEFEEFMGEAHTKLEIPKVEKENIRAGIECMSLIEAPLERWPSILVYARNGTPYTIQEDQFSTESFTLDIEILCSIGPVKEKEVHNKEGLALMEELDSQIQRLSDAVYLCIQKDKTLSGSVGQIEKPPKVTTSLPWARKESATATGETFIFQGKQLDFQVQKISY